MDGYINGRKIDTMRYDTYVQRFLIDNIHTYMYGTKTDTMRYNRYVQTLFIDTYIHTLIDRLIDA